MFELSTGTRLNVVRTVVDVEVKSSSRSSSTDTV